MGSGYNYFNKYQRCEIMYALVDCNNFYVSCERLFNPKLIGKPVIVLSNNDGCAIARSDEAKALGIVMGTPAFMIKDLIETNQVKVFSSNYTLYGDISDRVMKTLGSFVPRLEMYSIDEAFLDMHDMPYTNLLQLGMTIKKTVMQNIGIPVTVGIAPTKTLAKMSNRYAKKRHKEVGVYWAANKEMVTELLHNTGIENVWGIGHRYATFLQTNGIKNALDLVQAPEEWIRKKMTVQGQRLLNELKGNACFAWEFDPPAKKNICTSRSFGKLQTDINEIREALCNYAATCALKLRKQKSCCKKLQVFIQTNPHKTEDRQYFRAINIQLESATNNTSEIIKYANKGLDIIFKMGYNYLKCGIIVMDLVPEQHIQASLFSVAKPKAKNIMEAMDKVNNALGKETVRMAIQGFEKRYRLKAEFLSPCYTTNINQLLKVKI